MGKAKIKSNRGLKTSVHTHTHTHTHVHTNTHTHTLLIYREDNRIIALKNSLVPSMPLDASTYEP